MKKGWEYIDFKDVFPIKMGKTPPRGDKSSWDENKETHNKWVSIADISNYCEYLLEYYQIKENMSVIMIKVNINISNSSVNDVEYFLYDYYGNELDKSV